MPARPAHPRIGRRLIVGVHPARACGARVLVGDQNLRAIAIALHNLKGKWHVRRSRYARQITLKLRIAAVIPFRIVADDVDNSPLFKVRLLFRQHLRLIRDVAALDDALARRLSVISTFELRMKSRLRIVPLDIPIGCGHRLPNSVQVRLVRARQTRRAVSEELPSGRERMSCLTSGQNYGGPQASAHGEGADNIYCGPKSIAHRKRSLETLNLNLCDG